MARMYKLTHETLLSVLDFDPGTGAFVWKVARSNRVKPGSRAGVVHQPSGGRYISIDGEKFMAHRLAFFYVNERWPNTDVRPVDGDYDNCAVDNLREVSRVELAHQRSTGRDNKSGFLGVSRTNKGKWQAAITWNYKQISLGANFETAEEASEMYEEAVLRLKPTKTAAEQDRVLEELRVWKGQRTAWKFLQKSHDQHMWVSFEHFCRDVTEVPVMRYAMVPIDATYPIGPGNFRWAFPPEASRQTPEGIIAHNETRRVVNRDFMRDRYLRQNYEITLADERRMRNEQKNACLICDADFGDEAPAVDHDHQQDNPDGSKRIRGLLCKQCNYGMGQLGDNPRLLRRAAEYLERRGVSTVVPFAPTIVSGIMGAGT